MGGGILEVHRRTTAAVAALTLTLILLAAPGCGPKARLEATWPRADVERVVTQPDEERVWPLTGKPSLDDSAAASPAVMLAVSDSPASASLPGLDAADVVWEISIGSEDRLVALFHSALPASAGPLRADDPADGGLAEAYRAFLVPRSSSAAPLADVASLATQSDSRTAEPPAMAFASESQAPSAGTLIESLGLPLAAGAQVEWRYDRADGAWRRFVDGKAAVASAGRTLRATNVVVLWAPPLNTWPGQRLAGSGRASVFLDGRKFAGSWEAKDGPPVLRDTNGAPIRLLPGNTWFHVVGTAVNLRLR